MGKPWKSSSSNQEAKETTDQEDTTNFEGASNDVGDVEAPHPQSAEKEGHFDEENVENMNLDESITTTKDGAHNMDAAPFSLFSAKSFKKIFTAKVELDTEADKEKLDEWMKAREYRPSPKFRAYFMGFFSFGTIRSDGHEPTKEDTQGYKVLYWLSGVNWLKWFCLPFLVLLLWCFLFFLDVLSTGFRLVAGRASGELLGSDLNPIGLCGIGILATVLVQSSSTSTSIAVAMVGADAIGVDSAVYIIMGSNIGTSVTNTIVAVGNIQNDDDFRRAFQGSTVHDIFNYLCVIIFLPLQWATKFLTKLTFEMSKDVSACEGSCEDWEGPIKKLVGPSSAKLASWDSSVARAISLGVCDGQCEDDCTEAQLAAVRSRFGISTNNLRNCLNMPQYSFDAQTWYGCPPLEGFDETVAENWCNAAVNYTDFITPTVDASAALGSCNSVASFEITGADDVNLPCQLCQDMTFGLCDKPILKGGAFYDAGFSDELAGGLCLAISLVGICTCLYFFVKTMQYLLRGKAAEWLRWALDLNGYICMAVGAGLTVLVQSSTITTCTLVPLVAVGLVSLEQMYPISLGANLGTTVTGILAASVASSNPQAALQLALCHLFFNIFGAVIWYPLPILRLVPLLGARKLGMLTQGRKWFPFVYLAVFFFALPALAWIISAAAAGEL